MNIPLLIFDLIFFPVTFIRLALIYFYGSKYNIQLFKFLDVMLHANDKYFNMNSDEINTIGEDYRIIIRDDSRLFPMSDNTIRSDMAINTNFGFEPHQFSNTILNDNNNNNNSNNNSNYNSNNISNDNKSISITLSSENIHKNDSDNNDIVSGRTNVESKWMLSSEEYLEEMNNNNLVKNVKYNDSDSNNSDLDNSNQDSENQDSDNSNNSDSDSDSNSDSDSDSDSSESEEELIGMLEDLSVEEYDDETKTDSQILDSIEKDLRSAIEG